MLESWMLFLCVVAFAGSAVLPDVHVERLHSSVGGFAVMNCHLDFPFGNEIPYQLQWDKDDEVFLTWVSGDVAPSVLERWGGRVTRLGDGRKGLGRGSINVTAVRETDAGLYRCRVTFPNRTPPARNNGTFYYLDVDGSNLILTPPVNSTVLEGQRAEFECLPKTMDSAVQWFKDGTPVSDVAELAARFVTSGNGSLVIPQAAITDPGEYECRVEDADGTVQTAAAFLDVQYKAKVVYAPQEQYLPHGKPASLDCHFSANPPLTNLRWEKDGFLFDPYNVQGVFYSRNGSLLFNYVDESHEGSYSCTPYNKLGTQGASRAMRVRVQKPPAFAAPPLPLYLTRLGATVTLPCVVQVMQGDVPPTVAWARKDRRELPYNRHSLSGGNLTITEVTEDDRGVYSCIARNEASAISADTELLIENVPPRAPYNITAVPGTNSVHVSWVPGHTGIDVDFNVWYRERTNSEWRTMKILSRDVHEATVLGLRPNADYEVRILSQDHLGDGMLSKPLFVTTLDEDLTDNEASFAVAVTESSSYAVPLTVTSRLLDDGALVRWQRDVSDESRCTVHCYLLPERKLVTNKYTNDNYVLFPKLEDGGHYLMEVECGSGSAGSVSINVPEYNRLRAVAAGCAVAALLLAALAVAVYFARDRICGGHDKRRR